MCVCVSCVLNLFSNKKIFCHCADFFKVLEEGMSKPSLEVLLLQFFGHETSARKLCHEYFADNILSSERSPWQHGNHHPSS